MGDELAWGGDFSGKNVNSIRQYLSVCMHGFWLGCATDCCNHYVLATEYVLSNLFKPKCASVSSRPQAQKPGSQSG